MNKFTQTISREALTATVLSLTLLLSTSCGDKGEEGGHDDHGHDEEAGGHDDHEEHEEGVVELTATQFENSGIRVETAEGGNFAQFLSMSAVVAANSDAVTHINPKAEGIVQSIHKHLGDSVEVGDLLCVIDSVDLGNAVAGFVREEALVAAAKTTLEQEKALFAKRLETAERVLEGAIEVNRQIHSREKELQEKAVSTIRPLLEAEKALRNSELDKQREITDLEAERDSRLLSLEVALTERLIARDSASNSLLALGIKAEQLTSLEAGSPLLSGRYELRAPRAGIVAGRHITAGEFVDAQDKLYTLEDLSSVWILASAFERQISSVRMGQNGRIHLDAFPGRVFDGQVTLVGYEVDPESRALGIRLEIENKDLTEWPEQFPIRPGMFGRVDLVVSEGQARVVIPESAIVHENDGEYVFVQTGERRFERRKVEHSESSEDRVEITMGLEPGEKFAVTGTFKLKSAMRSEELGGGHSH